MKYRRYAAALFMGVLAGCGTVSKSVKLEGAVYAQKVPVYPSSTYEGTMGGTTSRSIGGPAVSESQSWFFNTDDSVEEVAAWYEEKLPDATKEEGEDGEIVFDLVVEGVEEGEEVKVIVEEGSFTIHESVKPGKKKDEEIDVKLPF